MDGSGGEGRGVKEFSRLYECMCNVYVLLSVLLYTFHTVITSISIPFPPSSMYILSSLPPQI